MTPKDIHKKVKKLEKKKIRVEDELEELQEKIDALRELCEHGSYKPAQPNICQICFAYLKETDGTSDTR